MPVEQKGNIINLEPEASASCKNQQLHVHKIIYTSIHQIFWFTRSWDVMNKWLISPGEAYMKVEWLIISSITWLEGLIDIIWKEWIWSMLFSLNSFSGIPSQGYLVIVLPSLNNNNCSDLIFCFDMCWILGWRKQIEIQRWSKKDIKVHSFVAN